MWQSNGAKMAEQPFTMKHGMLSWPEDFFEGRLRIAAVTSSTVMLGVCMTSPICASRSGKPLSRDEEYADEKCFVN